MSKRNRNSHIRTGTQSFPIYGKTKDGKLVVGGVYDFHQSLGMPLEILFLELRDRDMMPDWLDFYRLAIYNGMRHSRIIGKIQGEATGVWGTEFVNKVCDTLNELHDSGVSQKVLEIYRKRAR